MTVAVVVVVLGLVVIVAVEEMMAMGAVVVGVMAVVSGEVVMVPTSCGAGAVAVAVGCRKAAKVHSDPTICPTLGDSVEVDVGVADPVFGIMICGVVCVLDVVGCDDGIVGCVVGFVACGVRCVFLESRSGRLVLVVVIVDVVEIRILVVGGVSWVLPPSPGTSDSMAGGGWLLTGSGLKDFGVFVRETLVVDSS